jgi:phenylpropionate dioxygenase-like ring-hydroxylating dioxygenase large terminal subunit
VYATPVRPGECRLFARFPFQFQSRLPRLLVGLRPRWLQHIANHTVLEDDQVFLHWQERVLAERGGSAAFAQSCFLPSSADVYVRALHQWVNDHGGGPFPGQALPARADLPALMDRYGAHTRHCRSCRTAHARIRVWRPRLQALAVALPLVVLLALAVGGQVPATGPLAAALLLELLLLALVAQLGRWQQGLERGSGEPPRNRS